ncbi:MAG: DAK2 domain-containing protein [Anaerolineae bacterium]
MVSECPQSSAAGHARDGDRALATHWSGRDLRLALQASAKWLEAHTEMVNALNVYPVPDGDTGTNMSLTVRAALEELARVSGDGAGVVAQAVAHGALMGARGNSGVILSQILRGIARALDHKDAFDGVELALALQEGSATAYKGVLRPVEGTMLTVIREAAQAAAATAAVDGTSPINVLRRATEEAENSLARTPTLLPVLREAGVVDAGGQGLVLILQGMLRFLLGEDTGAVATLPVAPVAHVEATHDTYGYDIQFIMRGHDLNVAAIRQAISAMGDSVLVVGDEATVKVHVHSDRPGQVIDYGCSLAILQDVVVENMQVQHEEFVSRLGRATTSVPEPASGIGLVAVVPGAGLQRVFESLGVQAVVAGGQTMNPSTEELLSAVNSLPNRQVIILPNNSNVILTARQAKSLAAKEVAVVPTRTIPQGISALLALNYQADLEANAAAMEEAASVVQTIEVTTAVRSVGVNGMKVSQGDVIALLNDELSAAGSDSLAVALQVLERIHTERLEIITIYYGADVSRPEAEAFAAAIKERYPAQDVELIDGGQPHYIYIISAE